MTYLCEQCNTSFEARPIDRKRGYARFCSKLCFYHNRRSRPKKERTPNCVCALCGEVFYRSQSKLSHATHNIRFCSRKCKDSGQRIGGIKEIMPPHYGRGLGQHTYRSVIAIEQCSRCGFSDKRALVVHHKNRNRLNNSIENLECLCYNCHTIEHRTRSER